MEHTGDGRLGAAAADAGEALSAPIGLWTKPVTFASIVL